MTNLAVVIVAGVAFICNLLTAERILLLVTGIFIVVMLVKNTQPKESQITSQKQNGVFFS